ncbi:MAG: hypothetical protein QG672_2549, partial [Pseudomonadota bacterium]|nr:hypothetical protein [Pseudomonadota bacterium]
MSQQEGLLSSLSDVRGLPHCFGRVAQFRDADCSARKALFAISRQPFTKGA